MSLTHPGWSPGGHPRLHLQPCWREEDVESIDTMLKTKLWSQLGCGLSGNSELPAVAFHEPELHGANQMVAKLPMPQPCQHNPIFKPHSYHDTDAR